MIEAETVSETLNCNFILSMLIAQEAFTALSRRGTLKLCQKINKNGVMSSWSSSVNIVSDHRLDDRGSIPGRGKGFFL
jgi:hypothetical protein